MAHDHSAVAMGYEHPYGRTSHSQSRSGGSVCAYASRKRGSGGRPNVSRSLMKNLRSIGWSYRPARDNAVAIRTPPGSMTSCETHKPNLFDISSWYVMSCHDWYST